LLYVPSSRVGCGEDPRWSRPGCPTRGRSVVGRGGEDPVVARRPEELSSSLAPSDRRTRARADRLLHGAVSPALAACGGPPRSPRRGSCE
jgi:hypothetical protein